MDGKVFPMADYQASATAPPFHVWCRSTTVPHFDDDFELTGERAARDEKTGETYYVPNDMKYREWEDKFVEGGDKKGLEKAENGGIIKSITVDDVNTAVLGKEIDSAVTDIITKYFAGSHEGYNIRHSDKEH